MLPVRVHTIVISVQHDEDICLEEMREALKEKVIKAVVPCIYLDDDTVYHLQPSGRFVIGGPQVSSRGSILRLTFKQWCDHDVPCGYHRVMLAWRDVKSLLTHMVVGVPMEEGPSRGKITPRWTDLQHMLHAGWQSPWWRLASAKECWSRCVDVATMHVYRIMKMWASLIFLVQIYIYFFKRQPCASGVLRYWCCPPTVHLHLPLWNLPQEWERAAGHCEEEFWSAPWSHCQVMYNLTQSAPLVMFDSFSVCLYFLMQTHSIVESVYCLTFCFSILFAWITGKSFVLGFFFLKL